MYPHRNATLQPGIRNQISHLMRKWTLLSSICDSSKVHIHAATQLGQITGSLSQASSRSSVMIQSFRTDRSGQTVQTQIRLLIMVYIFTVLSGSFGHITLKEKPSCSTFRVITANFLVPNF